MKKIRLWHNCRAIFAIEAKYEIIIGEVREKIVTNMQGLEELEKDEFEVSEMIFSDKETISSIRGIFHKRIRKMEVKSSLGNKIEINKEIKVHSDWNFGNFEIQNGEGIAFINAGFKSKNVFN